MAGWRGGACAGGVPLRRPGRPPESGRAQGASNPMREAVSLPALDYAGAVSESALRRDGEGRSPMDPLRVTGSVGRGVCPSGFAGSRRGNLPPWDRWGNSPDADRTLRAGEQDGSAQNRRARSAGSSPSLTKAPTARRSAPPVFVCTHTPGDPPRERRSLRRCTHPIRPSPSSRPERSAEPGSSLDRRARLDPGSSPG